MSETARKVGFDLFRCPECWEYYCSRSISMAENEEGDDGELFSCADCPDVELAPVLIRNPLNREINPFNDEFVNELELEPRLPRTKCPA